MFVEEKTTKPTQMLEGKALLDKARSLSNRPEDQIARACGYVGPSGRLLKKSFYRALVEAKGYKPPSQSGGGSGTNGTIGTIFIVCFTLIKVRIELIDGRI